MTGDVTCHQPDALSGAWQGFVSDLAERLANAGTEVLGTRDADLDRAEGLRALLRDTRQSMLRVVEALDLDHPVFLPIFDDTYHLLGDTPDYTIQGARVGGDRDYLIRGERGRSTSFNFTTQGPRAGTPDGGYMTTLVHRDAASVITGTLDDQELAFDEGRFQVLVSMTRPPTGNWLPMTAETSVITVRNEFHASYADHRRWAPAKLEISRVGGPAAPQPLTGTRLAAQLHELIAEVGAITPGRTAYRRLVDASPNTIGFDPAPWARGGSNPRTAFGSGSWELGPDEALVIELDRVPAASFWVLLLTNVWMETLDFRFSSVSVNSSTAAIGEDGSLRVVVAGRDPGAPNWLDTTGHASGQLVWRWNNLAEPPPMVSTRVVPLDSLTEKGP